MRLAYLGSPEIAVGPLQAIVAAGHDVALVVSNADKRRGRGGGLLPTPVKAAAVDLGLPVTDRVDDVLTLDPPVELGVVVAFGRLIKPHVLAHVPMINLHFSQLPRWRGAAPVERAILAGDDTTAACVMAIAEALDEGDVYWSEPVAIGPDTTAGELRAALVEAGTRGLLDVISRWPVAGTPQSGEPTYAHKLSHDDLHIDWTAPAEDVHRLVRVGGAWTTHDGTLLKIWRTVLPPRGNGLVVPTGSDDIEVTELQPEGRPRLDARAWANGVRWHAGDRLGT